MTSTSVDKIAKGEKPATAVQKFSGFLDKLKPQIQLALPKHLNADRMARLALTQFSTNEDLQECSPQSIAGAIITAAQLGLEIGVNGQAYLIPYKGKATLVPGWRGLVDLVNRSGRATVWTGAVFDGDVFDFALGDRPFVTHKPGDEDDPAKLLYVYAIGRVNGSSHPVIDVWRIAKVWKHRDQFNKVGKRHYSYDHPEMYARKVPLLQVLKYMPSSVELSQAAAMSEAADSGEGIVIDGDFAATLVDRDTGEIVAGDTRRLDTQPVRTYAAIADALGKAKTPEERALLVDEARGLPPDQQAEIAAYVKRLEG